MDTQEYEAAALFEQRFWLQVLGDHSRFIYMALAPVESLEIQRAKRFIDASDQLLNTARTQPVLSGITSLNEQAFQLAQELRAFKLHLLQRHLTEKIGINLPPTFLNHMVNEVEEALRVMASLLRRELPKAPSPLHLHLVWLQDATGHSGSIQDSLDLSEKKLKEISAQFTERFQDFYVKAVEFAGYLRTNVHKFPALSRFNKEVELEMVLFMEFLRELEEMRMTHESLGTLSPLMADHMMREELYYLTKLSMVSDVKKPSGDPTAPRIEDIS